MEARYDQTQHQPSPRPDRRRAKREHHRDGSRNVRRRCQAGWFTSDRVECEIQVTPSPYGTQLKGVVHAKDAVAGRYELSVEQDGYSGHSVINQAGGFQAVAQTPAELGVVTIGGNGASYTAKLKVHAGGETFTCAKRVGGRV